MITRRQVLQFGGCAAACLGMPRVGAAGTRVLTLRHLVTGEALEIDAAPDGYLSDATMGRIETLLRDPATDARGRIDPQLIGRLLHLGAGWTSSPVYDVLAAYRSDSPRAGVGLHAQGRAVDLRLSGVPCADLAAAALAHGRGGVGYYRSADFVHLDTGAPRRWQG
jgi:uncharacterized protein YcbK (DUF882 family)